MVAEGNKKFKCLAINEVSILFRADKLQIFQLKIIQKI